MGHLVNPLLYRLNYSAFWNGSLITSSRFDSYINVFSVHFNNFVRGYFKNYDWVDKNFLFVSSLKFFFLNNNIFIYIDFWRHENFFGKVNIAIESNFYLFNNAIRKRLLKFAKFTKRKHARYLNYYIWKNYFCFKKTLTFFRKKISYKIFNKNLLNKNTKFIKKFPYRRFKTKFHKRSLVYQDIFMKDRMFLTSKKKEINLYRNVMNNVYKDIFRERGVVYDYDLATLFANFCIDLRARLSYAIATNLFEYTQIYGVPDKIDNKYWLEYLVFMEGTLNHGFAMDCFTIFFFLYFDALDKPIRIERARLRKIEEKRKEQEVALHFLIFSDRLKFFDKKSVFLPKFQNFKLNFLPIKTLTLLKKKKLEDIFLELERLVIDFINLVCNHIHADFLNQGF